MVIRAKAIQSSRWDEKRLLKSARPTMPPSPGSELSVNWICGGESYQLKVALASLLEVSVPARYSRIVGR